MPYTTEFIDDGRGIVHVGSGLVTSADIIAGALELRSDEARARRVRYGFIDLTDVTELRVSTEEMRNIAEYSRDNAKLTPNGIVAIVAPSSHDFGMARMWEALVDEAGWTTRVFRDREEALQWLRELTDLDPTADAGSAG